jgi:hypothetical protein
VEELTFYVFRKGKDSNPFHKVLEWIRDSGLHRPGVLVFSLHSVGILGFGAFRALGRGDATVEYVLKEVGMVFSRQTNSDRRTAEFVQRVTKYLGIEQEVPTDRIEHYLRFPVMARRCTARMRGPRKKSSRPAGQRIQQSKAGAEDW